jgi:hypothetical protein
MKKKAQLAKDEQSISNFFKNCVSKLALSHVSES